MDKTVINIRKLHAPETATVKAEPAELLEMMWQLAVDAWAFMGEENIAQSRLQRNVTNLIRRKS
jgi:hypothetical protein